MLLDELTGVIETLKARIAAHGPFLRENEIRTRMALIDPLLRALGWDVSNPGLVAPEYDLSGQRADYALLSNGSKPAGVVEAKRLGEALESHREQVVGYAKRSSVHYAGLTDGNHWELYEVFKRGELEERRLLNLSIVDAPAHECALNLLLLWRPNLASGEPVAAKEPVLLDSLQSTQAPPMQPANGPSYETQPLPQESVPPPPEPDGAGWRVLTDISYQTGDAKPVAVRFSKGEPKPIKNWVDIWFEVCQWLAANGKLSVANCPVPKPRSSVRVLVNTAPKHPQSPRNPDGRDFAQSRQIAGGLFIETNDAPKGLIDNSKFLLEREGINPAIVELQFK